MKVISFSLYGDSPKYIVGAARNILLATKYYPGWTCRFYINQQETIDRLMAALKIECDKNWFDHGHFHLRFNLQSIPPMIWRFMVADDPEVERFIVRDADSRIGPREAAAVREWEQSGLLFSSLRDHPAHGRPLNGGLWGGMWRNHNWEAPKMIDLWNEWVRSHREGYLAKGHHDEDQGLLNTMIWPWAQNSCLQHDSVCRGAYPGSKPFPSRRRIWGGGKRDWPWFVGEVFDENDNPRPGDWEQIRKDQE